MSRIGKQPVPVPAGVSVAVTGNVVTVKGPQGELSRTLPGGITAEVTDQQVVLQRAGDEPRQKALHGLSRTLVSNMVAGVTKGFQKVLEIQGVGYRAEAGKGGITLIVGLSHPVKYPAPDGIQFAVEGNTVIRISGPNKELVGQVAAELRAVRPPEPYKGKGIRYQGEQVRRKAGKTGAK